MTAPEMLKTLKAGEPLTFTGLDNKEFSVKFKTDRRDYCQGLVFYRENKCIRNVRMSDSEILNYLKQYENS